MHSKSNGVTVSGKLGQMQIQFEPAILLVGFNDLFRDIFSLQY